MNNNPLAAYGTALVTAIAGATVAGLAGFIVVGGLVLAFIKLCCGGPANDEPDEPWYGM